jgi:WD40 repeat protein
VAAGGEDPTVRIWDAATGKEIHALRGHTAVVSSVAFSPDGRWLASVDLDRFVRLWDLRAGREYVPHDSPIRLDGEGSTEKRMPWDRTRPIMPRITFTADSRRLATISGRKPVRFWDVATGLPAMSLSVRESNFQCIAFSRDGRRLAAAAGIFLHVWDANPSRESDLSPNSRPDPE